MANRQEFDRATRILIAKRATRPDGQMACERCGAVGCRLEINHCLMDAIVSDERKRGRKLTAADGEMICQPCHKETTAVQRKELARVDAATARHLGVRKPPTLRGQGFPKRQPKDRTRPTKSIAYKPIYEEAK